MNKYIKNEKIKLNIAEVFEKIRNFSEKFVDVIELNELEILLPSAPFCGFCNDMMPMF